MLFVVIVLIALVALSILEALTDRKAGEYLEARAAYRQNLADNRVTPTI